MFAKINVLSKEDGHGFSRIRRGLSTFRYLLYHCPDTGYEDVTFVITEKKTSIAKYDVRLDVWLAKCQFI